MSNLILMWYGITRNTACATKKQMRRVYLCNTQFFIGMVTARKLSDIVYNKLIFSFVF